MSHRINWCNWFPLRLAALIVITGCIICILSSCTTKSNRRSTEASYPAPNGERPDKNESAGKPALTSEESLMLANNDYWGNPEAKLFGEFSEKISYGKTGFEIMGPGSVDLKAKKSVPLVLSWVETLAKIAKTPFRDIAAVTMIRLEDNKVFAEAAYEELRGVEYVPLENEQPEGHDGELNLIDLRQRLEMDWKPGIFLVTALLRDQASNRIRMEFKHGEAAYVDPAVEEFLAKQRREPVLRAIWPAIGDPMPNYKVQEDSPSLPDDGGISLKCERLVVLDSAPAVKLQGSFRLPVFERDILPETTEDGVSAVIPISLVVTRSDTRGVTVLPLGVPIYGAIASGEEAPSVTGYFNFNLLSLGKISVFPQTFFISAYYGESMAGPVPVALVSEDSLTK